MKRMESGRRRSRRARRTSRCLVRSITSETRARPNLPRLSVSNTPTRASRSKPTLPKKRPAPRRAAGKSLACGNFRFGCLGSDSAVPRRSPAGLLRLNEVIRMLGCEFRTHSPQQTAPLFAAFRPVIVELHFPASPALHWSRAFRHLAQLYPG